MTDHEGLPNGRLQHRFVVLVATLAAYLFVLAPLGQERVAGQEVGPVLLTVVLAAGVYVCGHRRHSLVAAFALAGPAIALLWIDTALGRSALRPAMWLLMAAFVVHVLVITAAEVVRARRVTAHTILGAIAIYLLLAMVWAALYAMVENIDPLAFDLPPSDALEPGATRFGGDLSPFVYYSFVTLTTLGYGDVLPVSHAARDLSTCEAVVGQIYLTVLVARLVGLHIADAQRTEP